MSDERGSKSAPLKPTDKRFQPTKTGLIGAQRETMLQNELHYLVSLFVLFISLTGDQFQIHLFQ